MARRKSLTDIVNSVSEAEYRAPLSTFEGQSKVQKDWDLFKRSRGGGAGLQMISGSQGPGPKERAWQNAKILKNAEHPDSRVRATHQMGMALAHADTSGIFDSCSGCRTPECTALCNAESGHAGIGPAEDNSVLKAQKIRSAYWGENPQFAGALAIMESRKGARSARSQGMIPVIRGNMWSDVPWHQTTIAGPWVHDFNVKGSRDTEAIGLARDYPYLTHSNYTKQTMNRVLRPGEREPDYNAPANYKLTGSISEQTPVERVAQRLAAGKTAQAVVWAKEGQQKPEQWDMVDRHGNRQTFPAYDADTHDVRFLDEAMGHGGKVGLLRHKITPGFKKSGYEAGPSSFVRPINPDAPIGSAEGIPTKYAKGTSVSVRKKGRRN